MSFRDFSERWPAAHDTAHDEGIRLPPRPWQGPAAASPAGWGAEPRVRIEVGRSGHTEINAPTAHEHLLEKLGGRRTLDTSTWRWTTPGIALALWPVLPDHAREGLHIEHACRGRKHPAGGPAVFAVRKSVDQIGGYRLQEPLERGYACLIRGGHRALMRAAGWWYHAETGLWHTRTLHATAAVAAYAEPMVRDRLSARGLPTLLQHELRHAPALVPWHGNEWRFIVNTSRTAGFRPPQGRWRGGKGGMWKSKSTPAAAKQAEFAPRTLACWLREGKLTHALEGVNAGTFVLTFPEVEHSGGGGAPPAQPARPLVWCTRCAEVVSLTPLADNAQLRSCEAGRCEADPGANREGTPTIATKGLDTALALRLRDRGLATPRAWRAVAWAAAAVDIEANRRTTPSPQEIARLVPEGESLRPEQGEATTHALSHRISINGAVTGAGKTIVSALVLNALLTSETERAVIVVRAGLIDNWDRELSRWLRGDIALTVGRAEHAALPAGGVALCSYERMQRWSALRAWTASGEVRIVIADEGHAVKNAERARTRALMALPTRRRLVLSATPITARLSDLQPILGALSPAAFGNARGFASAYRIRNIREMTDGEEAMTIELGEQLRSSGVLYRPDPERVLGDLPRMHPHKIVELEIEDGENIGAREAELEAERNANPEPERRMSVLAELARLREAVGRAKVPAMANELDTLGDAPTLVFAHHHSVVEALGREIERRGRKVGLVYGPIGQRQRTETVAAFEGGQLDTLVLSMGAGGEGLNLPRAQLLIIAELDWGPVPFAQAIGRSQRPGRTTQLEVRYIIATNTLDGHMAQTVVGKANTIAQALGDEHGASALAHSTLASTPIEARETAHAQPA